MCNKKEALSWALCSPTTNILKHRSRVKYSEFFQFYFGTLYTEEKMW